MDKTQPTNTYISNPFRLIFKGFNNLFKVNQNMAIIFLVISILGSVWQFGSNVFSSSSSGGGSGSSAGVSGGVVIAIIIAVVIGLCIGLLIGVVYAGMMAYTAYATSQNQTVTFGQAFKATIAKFWTILWIQIIVFFKILGGFLLLIVPGIRAALRYNMVLFPVFADNASASQAIAKSKDITRHHLIEVFGMSVAAAIIPFINQLLLMGGQSVMYPQLVNLKASNQPKPPVHWLNYLGFILLGLFFLFIFGLVALVASLAR